MRHDSALSTLIDPIGEDVFFRDWWEKDALVVARKDPDYFAPYLSIEAIESLITGQHIGRDDLQIVSAGESVPVSDYTYPSGLIDVVRAFDLFASGATFVMPLLNLRVPVLADLCRAMEKRFSVRFQTNVYMTPPGAQGFATHYDNHDVFVLQVAGSKRWRLYDTPVALPMRGQQFDPKATKPGAISREFELRAGDTTYVPRGVMHDAASTDALSLHVTLGAMNRTWADLLVEAISALCVRDPAFRDGLPVGFADPRFDRDAARAHFKNLLRQLEHKAEFDPALDHFVEDFVSTRHPLVPGQLRQVRAIQNLQPHTPCGARAGLIFQMRDEAESVVLSCYGTDIRLPAHVRESLEAAITTARFTPNELPGDLDEDGRLVLIRRLIRAGLVQTL